MTIHKVLWFEKLHIAYHFDKWVNQSKMKMKSINHDMKYGQGREKTALRQSLYLKLPNSVGNLP